MIPSGEIFVDWCPVPARIVLMPKPMTMIRVARHSANQMLAYSPSSASPCEEDTFRIEEIRMKRVALDRWATSMEITCFSCSKIRESAFYAYDEIENAVYIAEFEVFGWDTFALVRHWKPLRPLPLRIPFSPLKS